MILWLDFMGSETRYIETASYIETRIGLRMNRLKSFMTLYASSFRTAQFKESMNEYV